MVAFGIGFIAGSIIPRATSELARSVEPQVQQLAQGAADTARPASTSPKVQEEPGGQGGGHRLSEVAGQARTEMSAKDDIRSTTT